MKNNNSDYRIVVFIQSANNSKWFTGKLNPTWEEWLMGWPLLWTSMEPMPLATWNAWLKAFHTGVNAYTC